MNRSEQNKIQFKSVQQAGVEASHIKKNCQYCGRSCSIANLSRHEESCKDDTRPRDEKGNPICVIDDCNVILVKRLSQYCRKHFEQMNDYSDYNKRFSPEQNKLGGQVAAHNRHHINKNFYTDFCELCIEYCNTKGLPFTTTQKEVRQMIRIGCTRKELAEYYNVAVNTIDNWRKQLGC